VDDPAAFHDHLRVALAGPAGEEPISLRVVAYVAWRRAEGLWVLGDASGALAALRAGIAGGERLPVPPDLIRPPSAPFLAGEGAILLGHPDQNRALGQWALELMGRADDAARWRPED
jgi:hypothetical protein